MQHSVFVPIRILCVFICLSLAGMSPVARAQDAGQESVQAAGSTAAAETGGDREDEVTYDDLDEPTLRQLIDDGDLLATFVLAMRFANGPEELRNNLEAIRLFRIAADQGIAVAQHNLGSMYATGRGVKQDIAEGARWYRLSAEQGVAESMFSLANLYGFEDWSGRDARAAEHWLKKSLAKGYEPAREKLEELKPQLAAGSQPASPPVAAVTAPAVSVPAVPPPLTAARSATIVAPAPTPPSTHLSTSAPASQPASQPSQGPRGTAWIAAQDPERYTLHIASMESQQGVDEFINRYELGSEAAYFTANKKGKIWHSVIYGSFDGPEAARAAAARLPATIRDSKPWVRKFASVTKHMVP